MALNEILDRKCNEFFNRKFEEDYLLKVFFRQIGKIELIDKNLNDFLNGFNDKSQLEYVIMKILEYLNSIDLKINNSDDYLLHDKEVVEGEIIRLKDDLTIRLHNIDVNLNAEMFTKEEYEELLSKIDKIAESLFEFQTKYATTNDSLYQSVEEIKEQLKKDADKGRIFGKEFVIQQLAGKLMDMSFKGSAKAFLSYAPEKLSDFANHMLSLL